MPVLPADHRPFQFNKRSQLFIRPQKQKSRFSSRFTKRFRRLVLGNDALQLAPDET